MRKQSTKVEAFLMIMFRPSL